MELDIPANKESFEDGGLKLAKADAKELEEEVLVSEVELVVAEIEVEFDVEGCVARLCV